MTMMAPFSKRQAASADRAVLAAGSSSFIFTSPMKGGGWRLNSMGCPHFSVLSNHVGKAHHSCQKCISL